MTSSDQHFTSHGFHLEPIAIIGMSCRFPGASGLKAFWQLLCNGVDAIGEFPADRFDTASIYDPTPSTPGKLVTRWGGFLRDIDRFDNAFFGISPREGTYMDPQQRLLLQVAWEALEDAGQSATSLGGSNAGVFTGVMTSDYDDLQHYCTPRTSIDLYTTTGGYRSVLAGRLSYLLDLRGPSVAVDTGCSSSLVAVHLACQSIWMGDCSLALASGTNLIILPERSMGFSRAAMLAPDGRCKFADSRADGFVRSEGVGVVVLKPLSQAETDGDPVYALIVGSAVNSDGRSGGSLGTPGQSGQEDLLRRAYQRAEISPGSVTYVEAHGTGTSVGDPIELSALSAVLSQDRPQDRPCLIGSVKTNIGHTEAAAGMAGLMKTALALKHRLIPPTIQVQKLNPDVCWQEAKLAVTQELTHLPQQKEPIIAGVNSFGISGANAHIVLQEAQTISRDCGEFSGSNGPRLLTISASSAEALNAMASTYRDFLKQEGPHIALDDLCYTRNLRRTHLDHRLAMVVHSVEEAAERLTTFAARDFCEGLSSGQVPTEKQKLVFIFPGHGSQWLGMAQELLGHQPVFRQTMENCDQAFRKHVNWSLIDELRANESNSRLEEIDVVQHVLFAMGVSLNALWQSWGIVPDAVIGHSMGEVAAAHVSGILTLEDAAQIMFSRGRLLKSKAGVGAMAVVEVPLSEAERLTQSYRGKVVVAGNNTSNSTVLSGERAAIEKILSDLAAESVFARKVRIDYASHSPQMDDVTAALEKELTGIVPHPAKIPLYSTVSGGPATDQVFDARHWVKNLRQPVRFAAAVQNLLLDGHRIFLELSGHPILLGAVQQAFHDHGLEGSTVASLRRGQKAQEMLLASAGSLYALGHNPRWEQILSNRSQCRCISLPAYTWQMERFWRDDAQLNAPSLRTTAEIKAQEPAVRGPASEAAPRIPTLNREQLLRAEEAEQKILLQSYVVENLARIIKQSASKIDVRRPLIKLGVDSLMAVELRNRINLDLQVTLPIARVVTAPSIVHLATLIAKTLTVTDETTNLTAETATAGASRHSSREMERQ